MSNSDSNTDMDRYFNDPDYRRKKIGGSEKSKKTKVYPGGVTKKGILKWTGITLGVLLLALAGFIFYLFQGLPSVKALENPQTAIASEVVSADGVVLDRFYTENRTYVPIEKISPHVINALVATEDHRFYTHWGIDMIRTLAVPWHLLHGRIQGGSTITQQLARNLYKKIGREFSIIRKLREMITAVELEQNYTKREIIEMYLNTVEFPNSAFGIQAAAYTHYGKDASDLTILQAATMVGSLKGVYLFNPRINPENAINRRNIVLMLLNRHGFISDVVYHNLRKKPIALNYHPPSEAGQENRYFGIYVRKQIEGWLTENGYNLYTDGLTIHTTINSRLQRYAEIALRKKLDSLQVIFEDEWTTPGGEYMDRYWNNYNYLKSFIRETDRYKNAFSKYNTDQESVVFEKLFADTAFIKHVKHEFTKLKAGFVAIDPNNGHILAWVGGADYGEVQFDHVYQSTRQAGSTFKPFVYTVAIANGYKPYHKFSKYPSVFYSRNGTAWKPKSFHIPEGPEMITLREGLARSLNNVTINLMAELAGAPNSNLLADLIPAAKKVKQMAMNFGIDMSGTPAYPSIALGTAEVSLLELVSAYTTFANQGVHIDPVAITHIEDKQGNIIKKFHPEYRHEVISPETAYIMVDMMRGVIRGGEDYYGTGVRLRNSFGVRQDVAGKTGTSQNSADNWFVAMMPHIVMGAWVGGADRRIIFPEDTYIGQGARTALPIVGKFINLAQADPKAPWSYEGFTPPPGFIMPQPPENKESGAEERIGW